MNSCGLYTIFFCPADILKRMCHEEMSSNMTSVPAAMEEAATNISFLIWPINWPKSWKNLKFK